MKDRILLVDDEPETCKVMRLILEQHGYAVTAVCEVATCLELFESREFDLVISDVRMPEMSGVELAARIKSRAPGMPVILITAFPDLDTAREGIRIGVDDYLLKPMNLAEIARRVSEVLEKARLRRQNDDYRRRLDESYRELVKLEVAKNALTAIVEDKIHARVGSLRTCLECVAGELSGRLSTEQQEVFGIAQSLTEELFQIASNLAEIRLMESSQLRLQSAELDIPAMVRHNCDVLATRLTEENKRVVYHEDGPLPPLRGDPDILSRVVWNLLDNGLRHAAAGETVHVVSMHDPVAGLVRLEVSDPGLAIPDQFPEVIFEKYACREGVSPETAVGGGMGPAFCKLAVEAHGGTIRAENLPGGGVRFTVALPVAATKT